MRVRPPIAAAALVLVVGLLAVAFPRPSMACSCAMSEQPMRDAAADGGTSVFTGIAGPLESIGVAVRITRWFQGAVPPTGIAVLDPAGFRDPMGGSCGTPAPGPGTEWIFVAGRNDVGRYGISMCSTHAAVASDEGRALLAEAITVFGPGAAASPGSSGSSGSPGSAAGESLSPESPPREPAGLVSTAVPIAVAILFSIGLVAGLFLIVGTRRPR